MPKKRRNKKSPPRKKTPSTFIIFSKAMGSLIITCGVLSLCFYGIALYTKKPPVDNRPIRIDTYFHRYNMPLEGLGQNFVDAADACNMDWRLLPAIAIRESSGGKHMMNNNPFGWGSARIPFETLDDAIREVGRHLCGMDEHTAKWYATTSTYDKLYAYNGSVLHSYPDEVRWIMDQL